MDDKRLIKKIQNGDKNAWETLVKKHYENIYAYCYRRTGNKDTAADLTQDIFLKLVTSVYNYGFSGKFSNYIFTIAVNKCNDYFRKIKPEPCDNFDEIIIDDEQPIDSIIKSEEINKLNVSLECLPDMQKDAIILHYFHDMKMKDIAKVTGVSLPTVKSRIKQGLDKLRKSYKEEIV